MPRARGNRPAIPCDKTFIIITHTLTLPIPILLTIVYGGGDGTTIASPIPI